MRRTRRKAGEVTDKTQLLNRFSRDSEERLELARALDQMELARSRSIPACTKFLSPALQATLSDLLAACGHPRHLFFGGYEGAERAVCAFLPDWQSEEDWLADEEKPVSALRYTFPTGSGLTHRDILGGLMGIGIVRACIGDILVGDGVCDVLVLKESAPIVLDQFSGAGRYRLSGAELPLAELKPAAAEVKSIRDTVATLRLDAVLSSGFSVARGKAADLIAAGRVSVNHRECLKPDKNVKEGDVLTCKGLGKCVLTAVLGESRKGRIMIEMERYL